MLYGDDKAQKSKWSAIGRIVTAGIGIYPSIN